jgi:hypothetical protein
MSCSTFSSLASNTRSSAYTVWMVYPPVLKSPNPSMRAYKWRFEMLVLRSIRLRSLHVAVTVLRKCRPHPVRSFLPVLGNQKVRDWGDLDPRTIYVKFYQNPWNVSRFQTCQWTAYITFCPVLVVAPSNAAKGRGEEIVYFSLRWKPKIKKDMHCKTPIFQFCKVRSNPDIALFICSPRFVAAYRR